MSWLPQDWISFAWGAVIAGAVLFASGLVQKLSEDTYSWIKQKVRPDPPEPERVDRRFVPTLYEPGDCVWVVEEKLYKYDDELYKYYPHPKTGGRCYRIASPGPPPQKEYLLVNPSAKKVSAD